MTTAMNRSSLELPPLVRERSWGAWIADHVGSVFLVTFGILGGLGALALALVSLEITVEGEGVLRHEGGAWTASLSLPAQGAGEGAEAKKTSKNVAVGDRLEIFPLSSGAQRGKPFWGVVSSLKGAAGERLEVLAALDASEVSEESLLPGSPVSCRLVVGEESAAAAVSRGLRNKLGGGGR